MANGEVPTPEFDAKNAAANAGESTLEPETAALLTRIYWQQRVEYQLKYYQDRATQYENHVETAFRLGALLMVISSLLASVGIFVGPEYTPLIALATAIIPALASYVSAFIQLYQWERQMALYRGTQLRMEGAKMVMPDLDGLTPEEAQQSFPRLVSNLEAVIKEEISQWGQIAAGQMDDKDGSKNNFIETFRPILQDAEGNLDRTTIDALSSILDSPGSTPSTKLLKQDPGALEERSALLSENFYAEQEALTRQRRERTTTVVQKENDQINIQSTKVVTDVAQDTRVIEQSTTVIDPQTTEVSQVPSKTTVTEKPLLVASTSETSIVQVEQSETVLAISSETLPPAPTETDDEFEPEIYEPEDVTGVYEEDSSKGKTVFDVEEL